MPRTTRSTSAAAARALRSGASPAKRAAVALERTTSDGIPAIDVAMASGRLKARKSVSGSGRRIRNGSTTRRVRARASAGVSLPSTLLVPRSSSAIASAEEGRSAGFLARAFRITRSAAATAGEPTRAGGCSWSVACRISTTLAPANAGRPASISNRIAPVANRSVRGSRSLARDLLRRHVARRAHQHPRLRELRGRAERPRPLRVAGPGQAEVEQLHAVRSEEDVRRLEVAMDDPARVQSAERGQDAEPDRDRLRHAQRPIAQALGQ